MRARRNARDYERKMSHAEARIQWAFITLMSRRLARPRRQTEAPPTTLHIFSDLTNGKTTSVSAFATLTSASGSATLYSVNLFTGATAGVGQFPLPITDIAITLDTN